MEELMDDYTTANGVPFDYFLTGPDGAHFVLYPRAEHTRESIAEAKRYLRRNRDVVSISVKPRHLDEEQDYGRGDHEEI